jgi:hypothetical protein
MHQMTIAGLLIKIKIKDPKKGRQVKHCSRRCKWSRLQKHSLTAKAMKTKKTKRKVSFMSKEDSSEDHSSSSESDSYVFFTSNAENSNGRTASRILDFCTTDENENKIAIEKNYAIRNTRGSGRTRHRAHPSEVEGWCKAIPH